MTKIEEHSAIEEGSGPPAGPPRRSFSLVRTQRTLQIVLGLFWLLDAGLQFQPFMFGSGFTTTYLLNNADGQPDVIRWIITNVGHFVGPHVALRKPPMPFGALVQWHQRTEVCGPLTGSADVLNITGVTPCSSDSVQRPTPYLTMVWQIPVAGGPTAIQPPDIQIVEAAVMAQAG